MKIIDLSPKYLSPKIIYLISIWKVVKKEIKFNMFLIFLFDAFTIIYPRHPIVLSTVINNIGKMLYARWHWRNDKHHL